MPGTKVRIAAFEEDSPVRFDINTVQPGILRLIPGITEAEVAQWLAERARKPYASVADFKARAGLRAATLAAMEL